MAFAPGELRIGAVRQLAVACHAAAREARTPAATAVARACGQAAAVAHMAAHARAVPSYVLKALALAHPGDSHVLDSEDASQCGQLLDGFAGFVYAAG
jgi:Imm-5 like putative immunity protein